MYCSNHHPPLSSPPINQPPPRYPTVPGYPTGTATGFPATQKPFNGYSYPSSATSFVRPGFTPVGFPRQGLPKGFIGRLVAPLVYRRARYRIPLAGALGALIGLELDYWLGLGDFISDPDFPGVPFLEALPSPDLAMLMGNGTQSCQKVMLWRYQVASLIDAPQIRLYFDCIDKDGDGFIDPWEFCMEYGCYGDPGNRFATFDAALQTMDIIDQNDDGEISPAEFDPKLKNSSVASQTSG